MNEEKKKQDDFIMLPTVDFCFKELMGEEKVRRGFIAALLGVNPGEVAGTELCETIMSGDYPDEKAGILDVRVRLADGTQMDMEMQVLFFPYWKNRIIFYLGRMYASQIKKGDEYEQLKKCIHVSVLNFNQFPDDDRCYRTISFCDEETGERYSDMMQIKVLELLKLDDNVPREGSVYDWMRFFRGKTKEELMSIAETDEYLKAAFDALEEISCDESRRLEYEQRLKALLDYSTLVHYADHEYDRGHKEGREEGRKEGREEGIDEGDRRGTERTKRIFKLHYAGKSNEEIAMECGVSLETVEKTLD